MNANELVLAAHVREIALERRKVAAAQERAERGSPLTADEFRSAYARTHPISEFVPAALDELKAIAGQVRTLIT